MMFRCELCKGRGVFHKELGVCPHCKGLGVNVDAVMWALVCIAGMAFVTVVANGI